MMVIKIFITKNVGPQKNTMDKNKKLTDLDDLGEPGAGGEVVAADGDLDGSLEEAVGQLPHVIRPRGGEERCLEWRGNGFIYT